MKLEHVAIWTHDLEKLKEFYQRYFGGTPNEKYTSDKEANGVFESYFLSFDTDSRLELMKMTAIAQGDNSDGMQTTGLTHIAFSVNDKQEVDDLVQKMRADGVPIVGEPRMTGDGYYEACVLDPDGNRVEITVIP